MVKIHRIILVLFFISFSFSFSIFLQANSADAISDDIIIYQVQTAGASSGTASQEIVLLYNQSILDVNVTDWCIKYTSSTDTSGFTKCLVPPDPITELWLSAGGLISFATNEFISANSGFVPDVLLSAGMAASSGHLRVIDSLGNEIDKLGWGTAISPEGTVVPAHSTGKVFSRDLTTLLLDTDNNLSDFSSQNMHNPVISGLYEKEIIIDICTNINGVQAELPQGYMKDEAGSCYLDVCSNIEGLQIEIGEAYYLDQESGECLSMPLEDRTLFITELLPNAPSTDTGQEFIELYNPNSETIKLKGYKLQIGPSFVEEYIFTDLEILAGQYIVFSDTQTGIILPNTTGVQIRLIAPAGNIVSNSFIYNEADDDVSWALVEDIWIYTNQITPNAANKPYLE
ncbi:MAG: lamin tail domain-containing protein, partial [Candidatus Saccharibacteria bacterium]|nr:lamin tail domain-containing protein [Candidatus Saccharibacteria bacterium]